MKTRSVLTAIGALLAILFAIGPAIDFAAPRQGTVPTSQVASSPTSRSDSLSEVEKIEMLIKAVASLKDAVFVRNGREYECGSAAKHMRDKWEWKAKEISTAREFIRVAASKSSTSGEPYLIKFKSGKTSPSAEFLSTLLDKMERGPTSSQAASSPAKMP